MKKSINNALSEEEQRMVLQGLLSRKICRFYELLVSFLCDESTNHPTDKIWWYMNS